MIGLDLEAAADAKSNPENSNDLCCGSFKDSSDVPVKINWSSDYPFCLGAAFGHGNLEL